MLYNHIVVNIRRPQSPRDTDDLKVRVSAEII